MFCQHSCWKFFKIKSCQFSSRPFSGSWFSMEVRKNSPQSIYLVPLGSIFTACRKLLSPVYFYGVSWKTTQSDCGITESSRFNLKTVFNTFNQWKLRHFVFFSNNYLFPIESRHTQLSLAIISKLWYNSLPQYFVNIPGIAKQSKYILDITTPYPKSSLEKRYYTSKSYAS